MDAARRDEVPRPQLAEAGLFLLLVAAPLVISPFTVSPFGDLKLVVLFAAVLCLWLSGSAIDPNVALAGAVWFLVTLVAALVGVDPLDGLIGQTNSTGAGAAFVGALALLAAIGAGSDAPFRDRAAQLLIAGGLAVAAVAIVFRVVPDVFEGLFPDRSLRGATMGNQVFAAAYCSAALAAVLATLGGRRRLTLAALLAFGCATFDERSTLLLPVVALVAVLASLRPRRRDSVLLSIAVVGAIGAYLAIRPLLPPVGAGAVEQLRVAGEQARLAVWDASFDGGLEHPLLGWGPSNTRTTYLRGATTEQVDAWGRGWGDAHNLFLETFSTTGVLGVIALVAVVGALTIGVVRARGRPPWALASTIVLAIFSMGEPIHVVISPLLFFVAGLAGAKSTRGVARRVRWRALVSAALGLVLVGALVNAAAATFERWGRRYGEIWALETSLDIQPWRLSAHRELALRLASDAAAGDAGAAAHAREVIDRAVEGHPWDPEVRLWAAQVEHLMGDDEATVEWIEEHVRLFPPDVGLLEDVRRNLEDPGFTLPSDMVGGATAQP